MQRDRQRDDALVYLTEPTEETDGVVGAAQGYPRFGAAFGTRVACRPEIPWRLCTLLLLLRLLDISEISIVPPGVLTTSKPSQVNYS